MKGTTGSSLLALAGVLMLPTAASAQAILQQRCSVDSLSTSQAELRIGWARKCALTVGTPSTAYGYWGMMSSNGQGELQEYDEDNYSTNTTGRNTYTGQSDVYEINNSAVNKLYNFGPTAQGKDTSNFWQWWRDASRKKARPLYPTFGSESNINSATNKQLFPHPTLANCTLYLDKNGTQPATGYNFYVNGYCEASCYTPEQKVLFSDGYESIVDATDSLREDVVTLTPDSTFDNIQLKVGRTHSYTAEFRDSNHPIVELRTASGGLVRVTVEHPVINGQGRVVAAQTLKVGDELVKADGTRDAIVEVNRTFHYGKVYNLRPAATELVSHVLVAEGYLMGSSLFQNDEVGYMNRTLLFRHTPANLIP
jgi:hypothetical protein